MTLLAAACELMMTATETVAGHVVRYTAGDDTPLTINAIIGSQTVQHVTDFDNLIVKKHRESFIVRPADLVKIGEPAAGHTIRYVPPGRPTIALIFTLRPDDDGAPVFRPTDRFHTRWRLSTVLTGKEAA